MAPALRQRISARIAAVSESATLAVDAKAKALKAQGEDVIGFGAGEPDFPTPAHIVEAAAAACREPRNHRYTPAAGLPELRGRHRHENGPRQPFRGEGGAGAGDQRRQAGGRGGLRNVARTRGTRCSSRRPIGRRTPRWCAWPAGCPSDPTTPKGYKVTVEQLERALTPETKVLFVRSPLNPTGARVRRGRDAASATWADERGLWAVTDEIYEHLVYGSARFHSMPVLVPGLAERCVIVNGVAKTYAMTGWRVGWLIGPVDVVKAAANLQSHSTSNVCNVAQRAALAALTGGLEDVKEMRSVYDRRRRAIVAALSDLPGVLCPEPEGAFYAFPSFAGVLGRPLPVWERCPRPPLSWLSSSGRGEGGVCAR